ncbi:4Fe-4S dicluster domain-containing protein [Heliorestis acidaminivorans]|uniref:Ferredoxin n=1 Tax=Heliorestis acidaminivorans TaxID=553427 RepID=A0A6I0ENB4_9FIRM|nr:4Fe-4S binding protein [Heliorestis acidaminivorans]KAB2951196.1 4Fe-4S dicluster domain-containing protein [Heliorestis acidaminivorans]
MAYVISDACVSCSACLDSCPVDAIKEGNPYTIEDSCIDCGSCEDTCPAGAISAG